MNIFVTSAVGRGPTELAAFDAALRTAGAANYNLMRLSSVVPPGTRIIEPPDGQVTIDGTWGDRLYVVMADQRASVVGQGAWAGIGWVQDETGKGLFVEHEATAEDAVRARIDATLRAMTDGRSETFGAVQTRVAGDVCDGEPLCALVLAVYGSEPWPRML